MSKREKLLLRLMGRPKSFTWAEAVSLMNASGFELLNARGGGAARTFRHRASGLKVRLHEPHPHNTLLPYMMDALEDGLRAAGELDE